MIEQGKNVLIIGAGIAGKLLRDDINDNYPNLHVLGFVDDSNKNQKNILGTISEIPKLIQVYNIQEIIVAIPSINGNLLRKILLLNLENTVPIKIVPRNQKIIRINQVRYVDVKKIDFEDFLGRSFISVDIKNISVFYLNKTVLITGGAGSIGSEIVRQLLDLGVKKVIIYDNSEFGIYSLQQELIQKRVPVSRYKFIIGNVCNNARFETVLKQTQPNIVFHAAAYKHVYLMEENPSEAFTNNVLGTMNVVNASIKYNVKHFTFISTDKVVNPKSVMGATKKLGELFINNIDGKNTLFNIVRFGNVINSNGSVLPLFEKQIAQKIPVTITSKKMKRFFMSIREAANLVIESATNQKRNSTYVLNMGELINIHEVALCLVRSKNLRPSTDVPINIIGTKKGEKLVEELFTKSESKNIKKTGNPKIWSLHGQNMTARNIENEIDKLNIYATNSEDQKLKIALIKLLSNYDKNFK